LASIFDTLLSSQEPDTHHQPATRPASGATLLLYLPRWAGSNSWPPQGRPSQPAWSRRSPRARAPDPGVACSKGVCPGTGLLRWAIIAAAVASVPPCRA